MQERVKPPPDVEKKSKVFKHSTTIQGSCEYCAVKIQNVKEAKKSVKHNLELAIELNASASLLKR